VPYNPHSDVVGARYVGRIREWQTNYCDQDEPDGTPGNMSPLTNPPGKPWRMRSTAGV
jgi:hypothetical protein